MSIDYTRVAANFSRAAAQYDARAVQQNAWMEHGFNWACNGIAPKSTMLDIGCGTGLFSQKAAQRGMGWNVIGLDIAQGMLAIAATRCTAVVRAGAEHIPFATDQFDGVFSSLALQWVVNKTQAFREIFRVMKPGALAVIVTLGDKNLHEFLTLAREAQLDMLAMESVSTYHMLAEQAGFFVQRVESDHVTATYASAHAMLQSIRAIGAGNASAQHDTHEARQAIAAVMQTYDQRYRHADGVYATWNPLYLELKKP